MQLTTRGRRLAARIVFFTIVGTQFFFVVHAYRDPHRYFGYQPFPESSTYQATLMRVGWDGRRQLIHAGWEGYRWEELVRSRGLDRPWERRHASYGVASTLDHLQAALDWVATHTPNDRTTRYLEAEVVTIRNRRAPEHHVLRSVERPR